MAWVATGIDQIFWRLSLLANLNQALVTRMLLTEVAAKTALSFFDPVHPDPPCRLWAAIFAAQMTIGLFPYLVSSSRKQRASE